MTGNLYALLAVAEAMATLLPAVGSAAARGSKTIIRRSSNCRIALTDKATAVARAIGAGSRRIGVAGTNAASAGEALSP